ncbi:MAG: Maf family protein [Oscillospiraceae bacterium]|nr:Maf family protein [Oscillospiraceae bacterium]
MIILASASPRRRELLSLITGNFTVTAADVDESFKEGTDPRRLVEELSLKKAKAVFCAHRSGCVIGADTVVAIGGEILGKPRDEADAFAMLRQLSGCTHTVFTGVSIMAPGIAKTFSQAADVTFFELSDDEIQKYIETGEAFDKAGAYGIQGKGALLVSGIDGDFYTVMGLPVGTLYRKLLALKLLENN